MNLTYDSAWKAVGGLGKPSKMPCYSWSISATLCKTGSKLAQIAGSVCSGCYALRNHYLYDVVKNAHKKRLAAIKKPAFVPAFAFLVKCLSQSYIRLYDAGDLDGVATLDKWAQIARLCPETKFWLPTKEYGIVSKWFAAGNVRPSNLTIRLSGYMIDESGPITLAKRLGVCISEVSRGAFTCPASKQGNKCQTCRLCWDNNTFAVTYHKH